MKSISAWAAPARREKLFADAPASVRERDTVLVRRALLLTQEGQYDRALGLLMDHNFKPWEGGVHVHEMYVLANFQKGLRAMDENQPAVAEAAFRKALEYPHNLGSGKPDKPHDEEIWFWLGEALKAQDKADGAHDAWTQAVEEGQESSPAGHVCTAAWPCDGWGRTKRPLGCLGPVDASENGGKTWRRGILRRRFAGSVRSSRPCKRRQSSRPPSKPIRNSGRHA